MPFSYMAEVHMQMPGMLYVMSVYTCYCWLHMLQGPWALS